MRYCVAGIVFEITGGNEYLKVRMADYALLEHSQSCDFFVNVSYSNDIVLPFGETVLRGERWNTLKQTDGKITLYNCLKGHEDIVTVAAEVENDKKTANLTLLDFKKYKPDFYETRDFYYSGDVFYHYALMLNKLVLHGSAVATGGEGIVFSAPSGTGKSTHTALWKKFFPDTEYINDDTPVIEEKNGKLYVCGSPWSGKTDINNNICVPLRAIVFLNRGTENKIERIGGKNALALLLSETRKIPVKEDMEKAVELCTEILSKVPVYRLYCDMSKEAVLTVRKELNL